MKVEDPDDDDIIKIGGIAESSLNSPPQLITAPVGGPSVSGRSSLIISMILLLALSSTKFQGNIKQHPACIYILYVIPSEVDISFYRVERQPPSGLSCDYFCTLVLTLLAWENPSPLPSTTPQRPASKVGLSSPVTSSSPRWHREALSVLAQENLYMPLLRARALTNAIHVVLNIRYSCSSINYLPTDESTATATATVLHGRRSDLAPVSGYRSLPCANSTTSRPFYILPGSL
ncbi:hypothetical protein L249_1741 [Ophiocordyceps polyrhachis-furcata BCC 54312]|uniref:Uncharacterized protein n=1 Tax=Ophiocordyceps polyrhachis-furcata BCC 54312 TaxID=1330021 RepID=A0A367LNK3_9HYPO|nr:hypothetical protein L249_1741 [Ophiocordyceps polyrhachis-furcata BCC 54312]